mgnify:CR=1 FL=1
MTGDLKGKRVLVTGGATGIGAAISRTLADAGALVAAFRSWHWSRLLDGNLGFRVVVSASRVEP